MEEDMKYDYEVIIIGAGPGGSTAARYSAQAGLKTLLIEKEKFPRYKACGGCLSLKTYHLLKFDLSSVIENTIYGAKFSYRFKNPFFIESKTPIAFMVMRDRFDQFLLEQALREGAHFLERGKVIGVLEKEDGVEVNIEKGKPFFCRYLIGADGAESLVARTLSPGLSHSQWNGIAMEGEFPLEASTGFPEEEFHLVHLDFGGVPNGYGWVFPKREWLSIGMGGMFRENGKINLRECFEAFRKGLPYLSEGKMERVVGHPLPSFYHEWQKVSQGRILLVGDAAHLMDPLQGEGIYYAILSGQVAAQAICQSIEKGLPPSELYQESIRLHIFENLKWALPFSRFVFRFTKLAYETLKSYPELAHFYLQVLEGRENYRGFVSKMKVRIGDLLKGRWSEKIRKAMTNF